MKIVLSGVETNNKGAELMLYAILQEIERKHPEAEVYIPSIRLPNGTEYMNTKLELKTIPLSRIVSKLHLPGIIRRLHIPESCLANTNIVRGADWFLDGSGFAFGDQWVYNEDRIGMWNKMLKKLYVDGCKIIFLPQAFGPVKKKGTIGVLTVLNRYVNALYAREQVSYNYLKESGVVDMRKVKIYPDFTSLVDGIFPTEYESLKGGICIIPNMQMINKGMITYDRYISLLSAIALEGKKSGHPVYLLNHEGTKDVSLCMKCKESMGGKIEAVVNLNGLQVKGLISTAYIVVTSRFHGLASALNTCVPSLATSWSHKYEELFKDYNLDNFVLPLDDTDAAIKKVKELLEESKNNQIREHLKLQIPLIKEKTRKMWKDVWMSKFI